MKGFKEFFERINSDDEFLYKFAGINDEDKIITLARAEGYDLEQIDDEDLDMIAGGNVFSVIIDKITKIVSFPMIRINKG